MRHLTVLFVVWLGSSVIAGAAAGQNLPNSGLCRAVENRLERCRSGDLSAETRTFCDRIERGFQELCGPRETILASTGAEGAALDLLRQDYLVLPIEDAASDAFPTHLVIGPADLDDPEVITLLRRAYRVGKTIAIANAIEDEARSFHRLVGAGQEANCRPADGRAEIELYGLQRSRTRIPVQNSSYCLVNLDQQADATDRRWLRERFGPIPPQPVAGEVSPTDDDDPTEFLTDLATATHCSFKATEEAPWAPSRLISTPMPCVILPIRDVVRVRTQARTTISSRTT